MLFNIIQPWSNFSLRRFAFFVCFLVEPCAASALLPWPLSYIIRSWVTVIGAPTVTVKVYGQDAAIQLII